MRVLGYGALFLAFAAALHGWLKERIKSPEYWQPPPLSPELVRRLSLGQEVLAADLLMIGLVQYFVRPARFRDPEWEYQTLHTVLTLDPANPQAWFFVVNLLSFTDAERRVAIRLLRKGVDLFPEDWQFPFWLSMKYYALKEYDAALRWALRAARHPDAPEIVRRFPAFVRFRRGDVAGAIAYLQVLLATTKDPEERDFLEKRIAWFQAADQIQRAAEAYRQDFGRYPETPEELVAKGYLPRVPEEPFGRRFQISGVGRVYSE